MSATSLGCSPRAARRCRRAGRQGAVRKNSLVKVLGDGKLTVKVDITAHKFSGSAREQITAAGGSVTEL
ncbi:ribosomal L18e/L15 family protein [Mycobacterium ulcerans str. Harvey]|uniref:50S ribosomal protein L15 n=1 Tax=Mycobacterium ulcerans str. Harvey TaxID=1299332 RepID=A0ABN0R4R6_MYCUL|nr:ribosomal L18e/L15 family protein [Mycobacterium ulcerans str. Harvey]